MKHLLLALVFASGPVFAETLTLEEAQRFHVDVTGDPQGAFEVILSPLPPGDPMEPQLLEARYLMCILLPEPSLEQRLAEAAQTGATEYCGARYGVGVDGLGEPMREGQVVRVSGVCQSPSR